MYLKEVIDLATKLNMSVVPKYEYSSFRTFFKDEHHISRICNENVLLIVFSGVLRFEEDGKEVEIGAGEFYIQKAGLVQTGIRKSDLPRYYYIHFTSAEFCDEGLSLKGIAKRKGVLSLQIFLRTQVIEIYTPNKPPPNNYRHPQDHIQAL